VYEEPPAVIRARLVVGPLGPGRAGVGVDWSPGTASREEVRRGVLTAGLAALAELIPRVPEPARSELVKELSDTGPGEVVDLLAARRREGLAVDAAPLDPEEPSTAWLRATLVSDPEEEVEDAPVRVRPGDGPAALDPATCARLVPVALARAMPRDLVFLARLGAALRALAREAGAYPDTVGEMVPGIAATVRDPEVVRDFGRLSVDSDDGRVHIPLPRRPANVRRAVAAVAATLLLAVAGGLAAEAVWRALDPGRAQHATVLIAGVVVGLLVGLLVGRAIVRRPVVRSGPPARI
jgi:hypothetical protein